MELEEDSAQREGVVRFIIKDFSQLKDEKFSAPVYIRNLPWRLMCTQRKVKVHAGQKKVKILAAFLQCNFETESLSWSCNATAQLVLLNQLFPEKSFKKEIKHRFFAKENDWGFSIFKKWNEILNTENGFLVNDTIIVEAHVVAEAPHGVAKAMAVNPTPARTKPVTMAGSLKRKFEEHLTCSVCLEPFKDPKVFPCLHSYCHVCIVKLAKNTESTTINCPDCRLAVEVDENAISKLPSNFFVNNLLATMALAANDEPAAKKICCNSCDSEDAARSRCNECGIFLCQFCTEFHKRSRSMKHHELWTIEELKSNPAGLHNIAEKIRCPKHKEEVIKLFCKTCQTTICRDCIIVDHRQHEYGFADEVAVEEKQKMNENLNEVKQRKGRLVQGIVNLKKFNESLDAMKESTIAEINQHFDEISKSIESRKTEMVEKATSLTNSKQKQIHTQLEGLEVALASCESSIDFTERAFKNGNNVQILSMKKYILQSLDQLKTVTDQSKPCVTEDMVFTIPSSAQEAKRVLLNGYDVDVTVANPENCNASFKATEK